MDVFTGDRIDAGEAYRIGLVNRVVPLTDLMNTAEAMARKILEAGPLAVRAIKQAAIKGLSMPLEDGLQMEQNLFRMLRMTEDSREGTKAFAEKRKPRWQAR